MGTNKKVKCKQHVFVAAHGSCFGGGNLSYHGHCRDCGVEMGMYGHVDENENGEATFRSFDGKPDVHKIIKKGIFI